MYLRPALLFCLLLAGADAAAQVADDPMEAQRCIWRCLANSPGVSSPEYYSCVAQYCDGTEQGGSSVPATSPRATVPAMAPRWNAGVTSDGQRRYAGVIDPMRETTFYVLCAPDGKLSFALFGPEGDSSMMVVRIDDGLYSLNFLAGGNGYYAALGPNAVELAALRAAARLTVSNAAGWPLFSVALNGAREAIAAACP
jgi:hypothetical protein